jgi:hypothetical protein
MTREQRDIFALVGVVVLGFVIWAAADSWSPEAWTALAAWVTVGVAAAAGYAALGQLNEAARLRREQAQPYVVAYIESSAAGSYLIDLVLKNFGATAAHDVRLKVTPTPTRAIDEDMPLERRGKLLPDHIPVLVPGQEWRTLWDTLLKRYDENGEPLLPEYHAATVTYKDSHGYPYETAAVPDWRVQTQRDVVRIYGQHDAAEALRNLSKTITKWNEGASGGRRDRRALARLCHSTCASVATRPAADRSAAVSRAG